MGKLAHKQARVQSQSFKTQASLKPSPFGTIATKRHHNPLNQSKATVKNSQAIHAKSLAKRKQSLLREWEAGEKVNTFVDKRIGENEKSESDQRGFHDKIGSRFVAERIRNVTKNSRYHLDDGDTHILTHGGQSLSNVMYEEKEKDDDEDEHEHEHEMRGNEEAFEMGSEEENDHLENIKRYSMNGNENGVKSKQEVMAEIIYKSKLGRLQKQKERATLLHDVDRLDSEFTSIRQLLTFKERSNVDNSIDSVDAGKGESTSEETKNRTEMDDFMMEARKLSEEGKLRAAERLKTPEEQAREDAAKLEALEKERVRRMRGETKTEDDFATELKAMNPHKRRREIERLAKEEESSRKKSKSSADGSVGVRKPLTDDDLVDNYFKEGQEEDEEEDYFDSILNEYESDNHDEPEVDGVSEEEEIASEEEEPSVVDQEGTKSTALIHNVDISDITEDMIPFTFPAPSKYSELAKILGSYPIKFHPLILQRMLTCNHIALIPENRTKNEKMYELFSLHLWKMGNRMSTTFMDMSKAESNSLTSFSTTPLQPHMAFLNYLTGTLLEMAEQMPSCAARTARQQLTSIAESLAERRNAMKEQLNQVGSDIASMPSCYFSLSDFLYIKHLFSIFPVTDHRHNVITPTLLLLASALSSCPVGGGRDVVAVLFTIELVLETCYESKRLVPEVITVLSSLLVAGFGLTENAEQQRAIEQQQIHDSYEQSGSSAKLANFTTSSSKSMIPLPDVEVFPNQSALWASFLKLSKCESNKQQATKVLPLNVYLLSFSDSQHPVFSSEEFRVSTCSSLLKCIERVSGIYESISSYPELFSPILFTLEHISTLLKSSKSTNVSKPLLSKIDDLVCALRTKISEICGSRQPMSIIPPVVAIKQHTPAFKEEYQPGRDYDPIKERKEHRELVRKVRREKKGAMKELRKDTSFLIGEQRKVETALRTEGDRKRKLAMSQFDIERRDTNILQKLSKKKK